MNSRPNILILILLLSFPAFAYAGPDSGKKSGKDQITLTGVLVDEATKQPVDTIMDITVFFSDESGKVLHTEALKNVKIDKGLYKIVVGKVKALPKEDVFKREKLSIHLQFGTDKPMEPPLEVSKVPWSMYSDDARTAEVATVAKSLDENFVFSKEQIDSLVKSLTGMGFKGDTGATGPAGPVGPMGPGGVGSVGLPGKPGSDGKDGTSCSIDGDKVKCTDGKSLDVKGAKGDKGDSPTAAAVATAVKDDVTTALKADAAFKTAVKGDPGAAGAPGGKGDKGDSVKGDKGDSPTAAAVATAVKGDVTTALKGDTAFQAAVKGDPGAKGDPGSLTGAAGGDLSGTYPNPTIADGAVTTAKLADSSVMTAKIKNGQVTKDKILEGAVTEGKIASNAVTTAKIKDEAVSLAKLGSVPSGNFLMGTGTGVTAVTMGGDATMDSAGKVTINASRAVHLPFLDGSRHDFVFPQPSGKDCDVKVDSASMQLGTRQLVNLTGYKQVRVKVRLQKPATSQILTVSLYRLASSAGDPDGMKAEKELASTTLNTAALSCSTQLGSKLDISEEVAGGETGERQLELRITVDSSDAQSGNIFLSNASIDLFP